MKITWDGRDWDWDPEEITVAQAREIKGFTGLGLRSWSRGIDDGDADALIALWWVIQDQNGVQSNITQLDLIPNLFLRAVDEAARAELERRIAAQRKTEEPKFRPKGGSKTPRPTQT